MNPELFASLGTRCSVVDGVSGFAEQDLVVLVPVTREKRGVSPPTLVRRFMAVSRRNPRCWISSEGDHKRLFGNIFPCCLSHYALHDSSPESAEGQGFYTHADVSGGVVKRPVSFIILSRIFPLSRERGIMTSSSLFHLLSTLTGFA